MLPIAPFRPRLIDALKGYDSAHFAKDFAAGLTVAVVALPLAMAFAIASGLKPEAGLFTAIIAGFLISALGGSRVQIGGPAGAFIVIVYGIVQQYGVGNLIIATALSGVLLFLMGLFKLGTLVRFIPISVIIGFTNGIAVLIALSQVKDFLGLSIPKMPGDFFGILGALWGHLHTLNPWALGVALVSLAVIIGWQRWLLALGPKVQFWASWAACRAPSWRWCWPRWWWACSSCRWKPSAASSAAFQRRCRPSRCPISAGNRRVFCSCRPLRSRFWVPSNHCSARAWPTA